MIVRDRPSGLRLFLLLRGSILQRIRWTLLFNTLLATAVTWRTVTCSLSRSRSLPSPLP